MKKVALLVIDVQNALIEDGPYKFNKVITNIQILIDYCRNNNTEIIYVQHNSEEGSCLEPNSHGWEIYNEIAPLSDEKVISKNYNSAFKETTLKEYLDSKNITDLIIVGMQTDKYKDLYLHYTYHYIPINYSPQYLSYFSSNSFIKESILL